MTGTNVRTILALVASLAAPVAAMASDGHAGPMRAGPPVTYEAAFDKTARTLMACLIMPACAAPVAALAAASAAAAATATPRR